jgi:hypothetical protein
MNEEYDMPEILAAILLSDDDDIATLTMDDFYDFMEIPLNDPEHNYFPRNDFVTEILQMQANALYENSLER